jgi:metallo-beta-lactamase class B
MSLSLRSIRAAIAVAVVMPTVASAAMPSAWSTPEAPFRIAGNTWYVGTKGITILLLRGSEGSILIDTGVPEATSHLRASLEKIGVDPTEIKLIVTSHAHYDHAGAVAEVKAMTGARVVASAESAAALAVGGRGDLHFGDDLIYPPATADAIVADGETLRVGTLAITAHLTPGHTPGSTSWTWNERADAGALKMVYADSITAPGYRLVDHPERPQLIEEFRASVARIADLPCDLLITPHPEASNLFERVRGEAVADPQRARGSTCLGYAERAAEALEKQFDTQRREASDAGGKVPNDGEK